MLRLGLALAIVLAAAIGVATGRVHVVLATAYVAVGVVSYIAYALDKNLARQHAWRISEFHLHVVDLCCGIVGGAVAQTLLHHKTRKLKFQVWTDVIDAMHLAALVLLLLRPVLAE